MAGGAPNNPYLDTYLKYSEDPDPVEATRFRRSRRAARYARYQKQLENTAKATEAQSSFGQGAPVELTPVEKRMKATQDAYESEIKRYGAPDPQTAVEFANTRDPRMVQSQLDQEAQDKKDSEEFWSAVESGSQGHIDFALNGMGPQWDKLRKQKAEVGATRDHWKTLNPKTDADEINRLNLVLESEEKILAEEEARLSALAAKVEKGISARRAAGFKETESIGSPTWQKVLSAALTPQIHLAAKLIDSPSFQPGSADDKVAAPTITVVGKALQRAQRGVAGQIGAQSDLLAGRGPASIDAIPGVAMFTDSGEARGEQAGKQWGEALAPVFDKAAFVTRKAIGGMETLSELGGLGGATPLGLLADTVTGVEKPEGMSDEEWNATGKDAMRAKLYGKTAATTFFETITDPLALVDVPFGKILKPFEKFLDKVKPAMLPKLAGKIREVVLGGHAIEDPRWAKVLVAEQALNLDRTAPMYEKALQAQRELQAAFDALPPEIAKEVRDTAPRVLEGIPVAERGGFVERPVVGEFLHGTSRQFDEFDLSARGSNTSGGGAFFTPDPRVARRFATAKEVDLAGGVRLDERPEVARQQVAELGQYNDFYIVSDDGDAHLQKYEMATDLDSVLKNKHQVVLYPKGGFPRILKRELTGNVLDLFDAAPPKLLLDALDASNNRFDHNLARVLREEDAGASIRVPRFPDIANFEEMGAGE